MLHVAVFLAVVCGAWAELQLTVDKTTGAYTVAVDGSVWLNSASYFVTAGNTTYSSTGSLKQQAMHQGNGADTNGAFTFTSIEWMAGTTPWTTTFREYAGGPGVAPMIVFEQSFPQGAEGTSPDTVWPFNARDNVSSGFPSITPKVDVGDGVGFLAFAGDMTGSNFEYGNRTGEMSDFRKSLAGVKGFGPVCYFAKDLSKSVVISSYSQFMAASNGLTTEGLAYGLQASVTAVPAGYSLSYVVAQSPTGGVAAAFEAWGDRLLERYGKDRAVTYTDYSLNYLGYSTDNGAFYYYQTEDHQPGKRGPPYTPGKTYEETLIDVKAYADQEGIPYKYVLLDSWWYYQGEGSGVTNWIGRPDIFPHGNDYLRNATGWPIMGHNRFWAVDNVYAKQNGGDYDFVVEAKADNKDFHNYAWPSEQRFWDDLLYNSSKWGLFMYEQDWLDTEYDNVIHLNTDADAARTWLLQMGTAASRNHLTIQYCMSHCRHIMQSVEIPAVTNARASGDYHAGSDQWSPLGTTGIFAWAVGIAPTKDNYWSTDVQTGSAYGDFATIKESFNRLQAAVSTISKGPVAPSDKIGRSDTALILKSCAMDGRLLQGDKPAMQLDRFQVGKAFGTVGNTDQAWVTTTTLPDTEPFAVLMGATLSKDVDVSLADMGLAAKKYVAYEANTTSTVVSLSGSSTISLKACGKWDFQLWALAPVLGNGWTLLGEPSKWVPVSAARFHSLAYDSNGADTEASVIAVGPEGEKIEVAWLAPSATTPTVVSCVIPRGSAVSVQIGSNNPKGSCVQV